MTVRSIVVGLGRMGRQHARAYQESSGAQLVGGVDRAPEPRDRFQREFRAPAYETLGAAIEDLPVDSVSITTPHAAHAEQATTAVTADIAAFVEKPLTIDPDSAERLVQTATDRHVPLGVGYQRRFFPPVRAVKRRLAAGEIGVPRMASCHLGQQWLSGNADSWRCDESVSGGGLLYDTGSHLLEELLWLLEAIPTQVAAIVDDRDQSVDVNGAVSMQIRSDDHPVTVSLGTCGESTDLPSDERLTIWGTEGRLEYVADHRQDPSPVLRVVPRDSPSYRMTFDDATDTNVTHAKVADFVDAVRNDTQPAVDGSVGVVLAELRQAIVDAWQQNRTVSVVDRLDDRAVGHDPFRTE